VSNFAGFVDSVEAAKRYPCIEQSLVEYPGVRPQSAIDRVD
jgi:hypothetical protein